MNNGINTASSNSQPTTTTVANKNTADPNSENMMLMALLGRNVEPASNNLVGQQPKPNGDVEKIQVRIAYQWKPYYREM